MAAGIAALVLAYVLSQFFRAFLAVLAPVLEAELGAGPGDLALASGIWFLVFALMQVPVGEALDRWGPRRSAAWLLALGGGGGAAAFALASAPWHVTAAMALIGAGCSPVLMAAYLIFARGFAPARFAGLAGMVVGLGSLGNLLSAAPLALAVEAMGWRAALWALAAASLAVAALLGAVVCDPPPPPAPEGPRGSVLDLVRVGALWPVLLMMLAGYGPAAGLRGLWAGPWAAEMHGADAAVIGWVTLAMGLAMVAGSFAYGGAERLFGSRKAPVLGGNALVLAALLALAARPGMPLVWGTACLAMAGFFGAAFPLIMAHGRAFVPPHLTGRGVTLVNLFGIGGAGLLQVLSRPVHAWGADPAAAYRGLFAFFALVVAGGLGAYLFARDRTD